MVEFELILGDFSSGLVRRSRRWVGGIPIWLHLFRLEPWRG